MPWVRQPVRQPGRRSRRFSPAQVKQLGSAQVLMSGVEVRSASVVMIHSLFTAAVQLSLLLNPWAVYRNSADHANHEPSCRLCRTCSLRGRDHRPRDRRRGHRAARSECDALQSTPLRIRRVIVRLESPAVLFHSTHLRVRTRTRILEGRLVHP